MIPTDRPTFAAAMARLFALYASELTELMLDSWWGVLQGYDLREIRLAMNAHATDPQWGHRAPAPSDIIRHLTETLPARRREAHAQKVRALRDRIAPLDERFRLLKSAYDLGILTYEQKLEAAREMQGLAMQTGALQRELSLLVSDAPRLTGAASQPVPLADAIPKQLETDHAHPLDPT